MFLAVRDLLYAKGRFALIGSVMALITLLVVMLTGLSAGLARESVSAISTLPERGVGAVAFSQPPAGQQAGYGTSRVTDGDVTKLSAASSGHEVTRLDIAQTTATVAGTPVAVSVFAVDRGSRAAPAGVRDGSVVVGSGLAKDARLVPGDTISVGGHDLRVAALSDDASFQHTPVVWMSATDAKASGLSGGVSSVALISGSVDTESLATRTGLHILTPADSLGAISSYQAENGSLTLMRGMLLLVSALVIGAFFTVWTIGRTPDLAVLKAMGARTGYLLKDALAQAALLLIVGGGIGAALATVLGLVASRSVPFVVTTSTTLIPLALLVLLGLAGAAVSLRRIATVDPLTALGAAR